MSKVRSDSPVGLFVYGDPINGRVNQNSGEHEWFCLMKYPKVDAKPLMDAINEVHQDALRNKPGWPSTVKELKHTPLKQDRYKGEDGEWIINNENVVFNFKRKGSYRSKQTKEIVPNSPPRVFDSKGRPLEKNQLPHTLGMGSRVKPLFEPYAWQSALGNGISFRLWGLQIVELAEDSVEVAPIEGGWTPNVPPTSTDDDLASLGVETELNPSEDDLAAMLASA